MLLKKIKLGKIELPNNVSSAPMAGFSDAAFRGLCHKLGAGLCVTEMVSAKGLIYKNEHTCDLLEPDGEGGVTAVQLFGCEPEFMRAACESEELSAFNIVDINMGCPVPKIFNNGEGSALMGNISLASKIIEECAKSGKIITVKFRAGIREDQLIAPLFAKMCEDSGAAGITVHGRTREGMYSGDVHFDVIAKAKAAVKIPVFANGGIWTKKDAEKLLTETGADGVAVARGGVNNPLLYSELTENVTIMSAKDCALYVMKKRQEKLPDKIVAHGMRKFLSQLLKGVRGAKEAKLAIFEAESCAEIEKILNETL